MPILYAGILFSNLTERKPNYSTTL